MYIYTLIVKYEISFFQKLESRILSVYQTLYREAFCENFKYYENYEVPIYLKVSVQTLYQCPASDYLFIISIHRVFDSFF